MNHQRASIRAPVVAVGIRELILWGLRRRFRARIHGRSMEPVLRDGVHVLVRPDTTASLGDVVLCKHPYKTDIRLIKRVESLSEDGLYLVGDNPDESTDSRSFGSIPWTKLLGVVTAQMK